MDVYVRDGLLQRGALIESFTRLSTVERLHGVGTWALELPPGSPAADQFDPERAPGVGIDVRGDDGRVIFAGDMDRVLVSFKDGKRSATVSGKDDNAWLEVPSWPQPSVADPSTWTLAHAVHTGTLSTILLAFVDAQIGSTALAARQPPQFTVGTDPDEGDTATISARFTPLVEVIADVTAGSDVVAWLRQVGDNLRFDVRAAATPGVFFSPDLGSLEWEFERHAPQATTVVVAGQGELENRAVRIVTSTPPAEWPRRVERFYDQRGEDDPALLTAAGDRFLVENAAARSIRLDVSGVGYTFRRDYDLGDWVTVSVDGTHWQERVTSVETVYEPGVAARVAVTVGPELMSGPRALFAGPRRLASRLSHVEGQ